ncbi:MAG: rhomboid family intramembrane serine protease [Gemmatimonadales bacterium]|nr:Rhomboid protease GluP [bacterium HR33]GIW52957.1 MAG: rhomboid family intramembrane serine protease [Gemmatimonadales bacterium]
MEIRSPFQLTPWVRRLLAANAVVYLLTITVFTGPWVFETFAFSPGGAASRPWTFFTYMFLHLGLLHLAFNLLMLFFFGPAVEERMGSSAFIRYYTICGLGGAIFSFVIALFVPVAPFVGASGAVFGVALAFALNWPNAPIFVFPLPVPIPAKWLVIVLATIDLALAISGARDGVAHLAHLGGFLFGFLYLRAGRWWSRPAILPSERRPLAPALSPKKGKKGSEEAGETPSLGVRGRIAEVDRLLDKISASGIDSLTEEERRFLDEISRELRHR